MSLFVRKDLRSLLAEARSETLRRELGPLALTRAMCPPGSLHDQIVKHWTEIRSFALDGGHLRLSLSGDGGTYEFEPSPKK